MYHFIINNHIKSKGLAKVEALSYVVPGMQVASD